MRYKATFVIGFGTGYLLGAKAGRTRYEAIMAQLRQFRRNPVVQETVHTLEHQAGHLVGAAKDKVVETVGGHEVTLPDAVPTPRAFATTGRLDGPA